MNIRILYADGSQGNFTSDSKTPVAVIEVGSAGPVFTYSHSIAGKTRADDIFVYRPAVVVAFSDLKDAD